MNFEVFLLFFISILINFGLSFKISKKISGKRFYVMRTVLYTIRHNIPYIHSVAHRFATIRT